MMAIFTYFVNFILLFFQNLRRNFFKEIFLGLGVIVGTSMLVISSTLGQGVRNVIHDYIIKDFPTNEIKIIAPFEVDGIPFSGNISYSFNNIKEWQLEEISEIEGVSKITPMYTYHSSVFCKISIPHDSETPWASMTTLALVSGISDEVGDPLMYTETNEDFPGGFHINDASVVPVLVPDYIVEAFNGLGKQYGLSMSKSQLVNFTFLTSFGDVDGQANFEREIEISQIPEQFKKTELYEEVYKSYEEKKLIEERRKRKQLTLLNSKEIKDHKTKTTIRYDYYEDPDQIKSNNILRNADDKKKSTTSTTPSYEPYVIKPIRPPNKDELKGTSSNQFDSSPGLAPILKQDRVSNMPSGMLSINLTTPWQFKKLFDWLGGMNQAADAEDEIYVDNPLLLKCQIVGYSSLKYGYGIVIPKDVLNPYRKIYLDDENYYGYEAAFVKIEDITKADKVRESLYKKIDEWGFQFEDDAESFAKSVTSMISVVEWIFVGVGVFILLLAGIGIFYAFLYLTLQREKEIGLYLFFGASKAKVISFIILEAAFVGILCAGIGLFLSNYAIGEVIQTVNGWVGKLETATFPEFLTQTLKISADTLRNALGSLSQDGDFDASTIFKFSFESALPYALLSLGIAIVAALIPAIISAYKSLYSSVNK